MSRSAVEAVLEYWRAHDVKFLPGVSPSELDAFERRYGVTLPADFREFYQATDGTHVPLWGGQDHQSYDFWPLSEVVPDDDFSWAWNFADYRELSWWYAIDLTGEGPCGTPAAVYFMGAVGGKPLVIADSFTEFLRLYVAEDIRLRSDGARAYAESRSDCHSRAPAISE